MIELLWRKRGLVFLLLHSASPVALLMTYMIALGAREDAARIGFGWAFTGLMAFYVFGSPFALLYARKRKFHESEWVAAFPITVLILSVVLIAASWVLSYTYFLAIIYVYVVGLVTLAISVMAVTSVSKVLFAKETMVLGCHQEHAVSLLPNLVESEAGSETIHLQPQMAIADEVNKRD